jgi:hypothetical protein
MRLISTPIEGGGRASRGLGILLFGGALAWALREPNLHRPDGLARAAERQRDVPKEVLEPKGHTQWVGPGRHFIAYYIRQKKLVNIVTQEDTR